jgi:hypothetical protein
VQLQDTLGNLSTEFGGDRHQRRVDKLSNPIMTKEPA